MAEKELSPPEALTSTAGRQAQVFLTNRSLEGHSGFCLGHKARKQSVTKGIPWWFCG